MLSRVSDSSPSARPSIVSSTAASRSSMRDPYLLRRRLGRARSRRHGGERGRERAPQVRGCGVHPRRQRLLDPAESAVEVLRSGGQRRRASTAAPAGRSRTSSMHLGEGIDPVGERRPAAARPTPTRTGPRPARRPAGRRWRPRRTAPRRARPAATRGRPAGRPARRAGPSERRRGPGPPDDPAPRRAAAATSSSIRRSSSGSRVSRSNVGSPPWSACVWGRTLRPNRRRRVDLAVERGALPRRPAGGRRHRLQLVDGLARAVAAARPSG